MAGIFRLTPGGSVKFVPVGLLATPGDGSVTLAWSAPAVPAGATIAGYEYSLDDGATWTDAAASPVTVAGLDPETTYTGQVRALVSVVGVSASASATTPEAAGFTDLFDGATLDGRWTEVGGTWQVAGGITNIATQDGPEASALTALLATTGSTTVDVVWELAAPITGGPVWNFLVGSNVSGSQHVNINLDVSGLSVWGYSAYPSGAWYGGAATTKNVSATRYRATIDANSLLTVYDWTGGEWVSRVTADLTGKMGGSYFGPAARAFAYSSANPNITEVSAA